MTLGSLRLLRPGQWGFPPSLCAVAQGAALLLELWRVGGMGGPRWVCDAAFVWTQSLLTERENQWVSPHGRWNNKVE